MCEKKKRVEHNKNLLKIEEDLMKTELGKAYKESNNLKTGFKRHTNLCKGKNGSIITELEHIKIRWKGYFAELLNPITTRKETEVRTEENNTTLDLLDIDTAIWKLKSNRATGIDNIPSKVYQTGDESLKTGIYDMIAKIWEVESIPKEWCKSGIS
jgi:hypothetical protein